jgi:peptidoglycan/xylan/chitin deacetylase (PgdA/CDA1 family)
LEALGLVNEVYTSDKAIAFTFDDGPNPLFTPQVLDIFREGAIKG